MVRRGSTVRVRQRACRKALQMGLCCCLSRQNRDASRLRDGYILGLAGTRGHARSSATHARASPRPVIARSEAESACKPRVNVAHAGTTVTPSFAREGVSERATHAEGELLGAEWSTPLATEGLD